MSSITSPIVPLTQANRQPKCGQNAIVLSDLIEAGFNVPQGFVITSDIYFWHLANIGLADVNPLTANPKLRARVRDAILTTNLPLDVWELLVRAWEDFQKECGERQHLLMARLSAVPNIPGIPENCFPIETTLDLHDAIRRIWTSVWADDTVASQNIPLQKRRPGVAVIVQQTVSWQTHGVTTTVIPTTGNPWKAEVWYEKADSESKKLTYNLTSLRFEEREPEPHTTPAELSVERAILAENMLGYPIKLEWAHDGRSFWVLQVQQLTNIPCYFPLASEQAKGRLERVTRTPVPEFARNLLWRRESARLIRLPLRKEHERLYLINGRVFRSSPEIEKGEITLKDPSIQSQEVTSAQRQLAGAVAKLSALSDKITSFLPEDLSRLPETRLKEIINRTAHLYLESLGLLEQSRYPSTRFPRLLREFLGSGSDLESTYQQLMVRSLEELVLRDAVLQDLADRLAAARHTDKLEDIYWRKLFRADVEKFIRDYGYAFMDPGEAYDLSSWKSWIEDPEPIFRVVGALAKRGKRPSLLSSYEARKLSLPKVESELIALYSGRAGEHLSRLITLSHGWTELRNRSERVCARAGTALRLAILELGRRMVASRTLHRPEDIFHLGIEECKKLSEGMACIDKRDTAQIIVHRKHQQWLKQRLCAPTTIPASYNTRQSTLTRALKGSPGNPGTVSGRVRVIKHVRDASEIEPGEIIVIGNPTPGWTPLLGVVRGMIAEGTCEPNFVSMATLYETPLVSNCEGATSVLENGDMITLDGFTGRIEILGEL
ncbi:MAG: PEP/pyruvate-binding domain-containing protein [Armatimonadota bacterium]